LLCHCRRQPPFYLALGNTVAPKGSSGCCESALVNPLLGCRITDPQFRRGPLQPEPRCAERPTPSQSRFFQSFERRSSRFLLRSVNPQVSVLLFPAGPYVTSTFPPPTRPFGEEFLLVEVRFLCNDAARAARDDSGCIAVSQVFTASIAPPTGNSPAPERFDEMGRSERSCLCGMSGCG